MSYALADPFYPKDSDASRVVLGWARQRYEFARQFAQANSHVVDAGCGAGFGARILTNRCAHYTGIDTREVVALVQERGHYTMPHVQFIGADLNYEFPVPARSANSILSFEVIEHLTNAASFLQHVRTALAPAGKFLISTPINPDNAPLQKSDHLIELSSHSLQALLTEAGFRIEQEWSWGVPFGAIARWLARHNRPVFREGVDKPRGLVSRLGDRVPGLARLTYLPQKYHPWGDWGVSMMVLAS